MDSRFAIENYIGGTWRSASSGSVYTRVNPANLEDRLGPFPASDAQDIDTAAKAAAAAFPEWSSRRLADRAELVYDAADLVKERGEQIAADMTRETGKPIREARSEVFRCVSIFRYYAGEALRPTGELFQHTGTGGQALVVRRPRGVAGLITPWNVPAAIPAWKVAPALVFGNTAVIKLSEDSPAASTGLLRCLLDAGLPPGVLNIVVGTGPAAGAALVAHDDVDFVSFTGSVAVGRSVRETATRLGKPTQLELGGHNPLIVLADADLDRATEAAFTGAFLSAGEKCTATRRILVEDSIYAQFRERFLSRVASCRVGDPTDPQTEIGPVVNETQWKKITGAVRSAADSGARLLVDGTADAPRAGYYIGPTVFEDPPPANILSCEEIFGPVTSLYRIHSLEEGITLANATRFGLSAAIFTSRLDAVDAFVAKVRAGVLHVNSQTPGAEVHVPFGGLKDSGWGAHEQGRAALDFFTDSVTVYADH